MGEVHAHEKEIPRTRVQSDTWQSPTNRSDNGGCKYAVSKHGGHSTTTNQVGGESSSRTATCFRCGKEGHVAKEGKCPTHEKRRGTRAGATAVGKKVISAVMTCVPLERLNAGNVTTLDITTASARQR